MKKLLVLLIISCSCFLPASYATERNSAIQTASSKRISYKGGDGTSIEKAVIIIGAKSSADGVPAEYAWLRKKYRGYKTESQGLLNQDNKWYDRITILSSKGKQITVFFDISAFYGKI